RAGSAKSCPAVLNQEELEIMRAMRAEGFEGYQDLKLVDTPKPHVSDGRVLVKITAAGVTPLEHTILSGGYPRAKAPLVLGSEGAGVVEDANGSEFSAGARVMRRTSRPASGTRLAAPSPSSTACNSSPCVATLRGLAVCSAVIGLLFLIFCP